MINVPRESPSFCHIPYTKTTSYKFPGNVDSFFQNIMQVLKTPFPPSRASEFLKTLEIPTIFFYSKQEPEIWERNKVLRGQGPGPKMQLHLGEHSKGEASSKVATPNMQKLCWSPEPRGRYPVGPSCVPS